MEMKEIANDIKILVRTKVDPELVNVSDNERENSLENQLFTFKVDKIEYNQQYIQWLSDKGSVVSINLADKTISYFDVDLEDDKCYDYLEYIIRWEGLTLFEGVNHEQE